MLYILRIFCSLYIMMGTFFFGFLTGLVTTIVGITGALYFIYVMWMRPVIQKMEGHEGLPEPSIMRARLSTPLALQTLDGTPVPPESFSGKFLFINFWATWCAPCVAEMPSIQKLHDAMKSRENFAMICVARDERSEAIIAFLKENEYSMPVYMLDGEPPEELAMPGIPTTFLIAPDGIIVMRHACYANWNSEKFIAHLEALLPRL